MTPATGRRAACRAVLALALAGCEQGAPEVDPHLEAGASPNASILPAPLATEAPEAIDSGLPDGAIGGLLADSSGRLILPDAGSPPPEVLRPDVAMTPENASPRDVAGVSLEAVWRWRDVPAPAKGPEVSLDGIKAAQKLTPLTWKIDLSDAGRMRIDFTSRALPLPTHTEIRSRYDRFGHLVLWPSSTDYRVIAPGALRPVLGERRVDVTPLTMATASPQGEGRRLGVATRKLELSSSIGHVKLEIAKVPESGDGGALLCRTLVEIVGVDPKTTACQSGEVPLFAAFAWREGGGIGFEVTALARRTDLAYNELLVPPPGATFSPSGLPIAPGGIFLTREELAAFRTGAIAIPPRTDPSLPGEGFLAKNASDTLMYLLLDGVPVVAVPPASERYLIGTARGRYVAQWRSFLGDHIGPPQVAEVPARITYGTAADAGAPDGG